MLMNNLNHEPARRSVNMRLLELVPLPASVFGLDKTWPNNTPPNQGFPARVQPLTARGQ